MVNCYFFFIFIFQQINLHFTLCSVACFLRVPVQYVHQNAAKSTDQTMPAIMDNAMVWNDVTCLLKGNMPQGLA